MFDKTKARISEQVNDRVTTPVRTSIMIALTAIIIAGIALIMSVNRAHQ